jgi:hypothetical protein
MDGAFRKMSPVEARPENFWMSGPARKPTLGHLLLAGEITNDRTDYNLAAQAISPA